MLIFRRVASNNKTKAACIPFISSFSTVPNQSISPAEKELYIYASKKQTPVSLKSLMETGKGDRLSHFDELMKARFISTNSHGANNTPPTKATPVASQRILIQVACFLHRELPVRLAQRAVKLDASPLFQRSGNIKQVSSWYKTSFQQLRACPVPNDPEKEAHFAKIIESIYERHSSTLITMAKGAHEIRNMLKQDVASFADFDDIQKRLDDFYMSRIGIRMVRLYLLFSSDRIFLIFCSFILTLVGWTVSSSSSSIS
jgi:hypothetical protein